MAPLQDIIVNQLKAARQKRAFAFRQTIARIFGFIAQNKFSIDEEFVLDSSKRSLDSRIACGKKTHERDCRAGRSGDQDNPLGPLHSRMRVFDRDLIRGEHYGQRSCEPHSKAEHMAAPTKPAT